jgi:hypothetical protein
MAGEFMAAMAVYRAREENAEVFRGVFREMLIRMMPMSAEDKECWQDLVAFVFAVGLRRPNGEREELKRIARESHTSPRDQQQVMEMLATIERGLDELSTREDDS